MFCKKARVADEAPASPVTKNIADGWVLVTSLDNPCSTPSWNADSGSVPHTKLQSPAKQGISAGETGTAVNEAVKQRGGPTHIISFSNLKTRCQESRSTSSFGDDEPSLSCECSLRDRTRSSATAAEEILGQQFEDSELLPIPPSARSPAAASKGELYPPKSDPGNDIHDQVPSVCSFLIYFLSNSTYSFVHFCAPMLPTSWSAFYNTMSLDNVIYCCVFAAAAVGVVQLGPSIMPGASDESGRCCLLGVASRTSQLVCVFMVVVGPLLRLGEKLLEELFPCPGTTPCPAPGEERREETEECNREQKEDEAQVQKAKCLTAVKVFLSSLLTFILLTNEGGGSTANRQPPADDEDSRRDAANEPAAHHEGDKTSASAERRIRTGALLLIGVGGGAISQYVLLRCS
ncbi:uncharacterized protein Tco025E_06250 [Trypanosoma conorhini]|uniref:Uncharacterized protein n=1 Tax=Trypanosoma conorhini TaxID=83891 RepID=A0A422P6B8_9TRYP|nr:uncharacterized protein Tco025E_06250 [Trypanosoma conorhini]RNF13269.1 hypothetical protein Tco025E_06250 [Trypanosoma conorhini]